MLVSIIVPVYNVKPYLDEAINSVLNQTYTNLEIILIDDGSTDGSETVCDHYAKVDDRVIVIHQENKGLSAARNIGLNEIHGDLVAFFDSDDALHPDYVARMVDAMNRENADLVVCRYKVFHTTKSFNNAIPENVKIPIESGNYKRIEALQGLVVNKVNHGVWNKLYKKNLWKSIRFPDGHVFEDIDTTYKILNCCDMVTVIDDELYLHRKRPRSISANLEEKSINDWLLANAHFDSFISENIPEIFSKAQADVFHRVRLNTMIKTYILSNKLKNNNKRFRNDLRKHIIETGNKYDGLGFSTTIAFHMICICPLVLTMAYPFFSIIRIIWEKH